MKEKEDRRVRKTKKLLREGLAKLMLEKPVKNITVREISELVDINRGTFYLHYKDIYDMVEQIQNEIFDEFYEIINSYEITQSENDVFAMLTDIFKFLRDNSELAKSLIGENGDAAFVERLKNLLRNKCFTELSQKHQIRSEEEFMYHYAFIVSGSVGIFQRWLNSGMKESPEEMAKFMEKLIHKGMAGL